MAAIAYLNWGRWVADCPTPGCTNAAGVAPGRTTVTCVGAEGSHCGYTYPLVWPSDPKSDYAGLAGLPPAQQSQPIPGSEQSPAADATAPEEP